jgi:hypothetical protein
LALWDSLVAESIASFRSASPESFRLKMSISFKLIQKLIWFGIETQGKGLFLSLAHGLQM